MRRRSRSGCSVGGCFTGWHSGGSRRALGFSMTGPCPETNGVRRTGRRMSPRQCGMESLEHFPLTQLCPGCLMWMEMTSASSMISAGICAWTLTPHQDKLGIKVLFKIKRELSLLSVEDSQENSLSLMGLSKKSHSSFFCM